MPPRKSATLDDDEPLADPPAEPEEDQPEEDEPDEPDEPDEEESEEDGEGEEDGEEGEGESETQVAWADDEAPAEGGDTNTVIRKIRERNKELARENAELKAARQAAEPEPDLGPKPTMADFDYDEEEFEKELDKWKERKAKAEARKTAQDQQNEAANREWQSDLSGYEAKRNALAVADFEEVIEPVKNSLSLVQQAVILKAAQDPAAFSYALGGSDARLAELAKIQDPIKLAAAIARMEGGIRVTKRRKAPPPDRPARGSARISTESADKQLAKLEEAARESGDRTAVVNYKRKLAAKKSKAA